MNHTPGPWKVTRTDRSPCAIEAPSHEDSAIAKVYLSHPKTRKHTDEFMANARLIAAAPELLDAMQRLSLAASRRDNVSGDPIALMDAKAELLAANQQAMAAIKAATAPA